MCLGMNPDILSAGERCASTSNRNFEGRQGSRAAGRTSSHRKWRRQRPSPATSSTSETGSSQTVNTTTSDLPPKAAEFARILQEHMPELESEYGVASLALFGSYVRGDEH